MATEDALNQVAQARRRTDELIRRIRGNDAASSFTNSDVPNSGSLRQLEVREDLATISGRFYFLFSIMATPAGLYAEEQAFVHAECHSVKVLLFFPEDDLMACLFFTFGFISMHRLICKCTMIFNPL